MSRVLTPQELQILRSDGLSSKLYAIIDQPVTVFTCQVNQNFSAHQPVAQIIYNNPSGTLSKVLPGMTVLIGTSAGAWDRGIVRVRKAWTSTTAYIGETAEIEWANGLYLTVVDEFAIWPRHLRIVGDIAYMDYDIAYSDQHNNYNPVVCMGPDRVVRLVGSSIDVNLDASQSWIFGSTITQYAWEVLTGNGTLTNANTATPTLTVTAAGRIVLRCTVTAANGKSASSYRTVYIYDDNNPPVEIQLNNLVGDINRGGFEFSIALARPINFVPRDYLKVVLFSEDYPQSIGLVSGAENILAIGWIDEKECTVDQHSGESTLSVKGAHHWLNLAMTYPTGIENVSQAPTSWTQMQNLTVDKAIWHLLYWHTTLSNCADVYLSGDTRIAQAFHVTGNVWQQIKLIAEDSILATPFCDALGRFFLQIHPNLRSETERTQIPVIMELTRDDFEHIDVSMRSLDVSQCEVSGVDQNGKPVVVKSPGNVFSRYGQIISKEKLLFFSNQHALELAGLILERESRPYDFSIDLVSADRVIGLVPFGYLQLSIGGADTPARISYTGRAIPYRVDYRFENGYLKQTVYAEPEVFARAAESLNYSNPPVVGTPEYNVPEFSLPTWPALTPSPGGFTPPLIPPENPLPPVPPDGGDTCPIDAPASGPFIWTIRYTLFDNTNYAIYIPMLAVIRSSSHANKTIWGIRGRFLKKNGITGEWEETTNNNWWNIYAYNRSGQRIATGIKDDVTQDKLRYRTGTFQPPAAAQIAYVGIEIESGLLRPSQVVASIKPQHFWDDWSIFQPELSWGYYGAGIWAYAKNGGFLSKYSSFGSSVIQLGAIYEFNNVNLIVEQHIFGYREGSGSFHTAKGVIHRGYHGISWQTLWERAITGTVTPMWLRQIGVKSNTVGGQVTRISAELHWYVPPGYPQVRFVIDHLIYVWKDLNYKIEIEQLEMWNLCPASG